MANKTLKFPLIILAAGKSSRMRQPKGLIRLNGRFWLEEQLERFHAAGGNSVVVVLGFYEPQYREALSLFVALEQDGFLYKGMSGKIVINPQPDKGSFSSLQKALLDDTVKYSPGVFVLPVDVPAPKPDVWKKLAENLKSLEAITPCWNGKGGHPVLLGKNFLQKMATLSPEEDELRLDRQIAKIPDSLRMRMEVSDPQIRLNLNTLSDWNRFCEKL